MRNDERIKGKEMGFEEPRLGFTQDHDVLHPAQGRAEGCLLGQFAGDSLGSLVESHSAEEIGQRYPAGVRDMHDGGAWDTIAGQLTDDSEMALSLAHMLIGEKTYDQEKARAAYRTWLHSTPFDCGNKIRAGLAGTPDPRSQANGALMRVAPLGIFGSRFPLEEVARWAKEDAALTHPHRTCQDANALFAMAIAFSIQYGPSPSELYEKIVGWAHELEVGDLLVEILYTEDLFAPSDYHEYSGWVIIAFHNALYHLRRASSIEEAIVATVARGGDTDTNAAICGALLGAVHGARGIPDRWQQCLTNCRPEAGTPGVKKPRPGRYWPNAARRIAQNLLADGRC